MTGKSLCLLLAVGLCVSLAALGVWAAYFFRQWKQMERLLEDFQRGRFSKESGPYDTLDVQETRESRLVSQLRQILNQASGTEQKAVKEKNQVMELISDLSHQLKTPLANILMNMEILKEDTLDRDQRREFLERTSVQAGKMKWLMENLLKASRLENGIIHFQAENRGIKETLARAVGSVYAQASKKRIQLQMEEFQDVPLYHNSRWTAEAVGNILENAVKYSPEGSVITISLHPLELYTRITITDQGMGIPKEDYNRIFQRFYRGRQTEEEEGNGLGLYLAQLILQSEKGYVTVSSQVGAGSSFSVFLLNQE